MNIGRADLIVREEVLNPITGKVEFRNYKGGGTSYDGRRTCPGLCPGEEGGEVSDKEREVDERISERVRKTLTSKDNVGLESRHLCSLDGNYHSGAPCLDVSLWNGGCYVLKCIEEAAKARNNGNIPDGLAEQILIIKTLVGGRKKNGWK